MCQCTPEIRTPFCDKCIKNAGKPAKLDPVIEAVRSDLHNRSQLGIKKYGTTLADNSGNLRYWVNHAYEECLDQANYLKRVIMEIDKENELPENVYYSVEHDNFYSLETSMGMGTPFYEKWKNRFSEFPKIDKI